MNYAYTSTAGIIANVPKNIHKMIQHGMVFNHVQGGKLNKRCAFVETEAPVVVEKAAATADKPATVKVTAKAKVKVAKPVAKKVPGAPSKADLVRARIAIVKANNGSIEDVISYGINELGQSKTQAQTYAKNNWDKV